MESHERDVRPETSSGNETEEKSLPPLYGAVDLGTNNCRLLMARPSGDGFHVIEAFSRITRLGEGLTRSSALSEAAMARTVSALKQCMLRIERRGARRVRAVATEACRRADNCGPFLHRVRLETGFDLEIISSDDEARLALAGCAPLLDRTQPFALVFDIGGGSTELIKVRLDSKDGSEHIEKLASLPLGVVTLAEDRHHHLHDGEGYRRAVDALCERFAAFDADGSLRRLADDGQLQLLGTSGTVTTLGAIHLGLPRYDRGAVDGLVMSFSAIEAVSRQLASSTAEERTSHPCIGQDRADLVVAGCAILEAICRLWPAGRLSVADRGVREGVLLSMMRADQLAGKQ